MLKKKGLGHLLMGGENAEVPSSFSGVVKHLKKVQLMDNFAKRLKELAVQAQDAVTIDSAMNNSSILVAVRLRPFLKYDQTYDSKETCLSIKGNTIDIQDVRDDEERAKKSHTFKFDVFLPATVTQSRVYVATAKRIFVKVLKGYNGTIFTYGQTGSGKTHTMLGDENDPGIIPRVGMDLMHEMDRQRGKTAFKVFCSFVEIYREKVSDLLAAVNDEDVEHNQARSTSGSVLKAVAKMRKNSTSGINTASQLSAASTFLKAHFHDYKKDKKKKKKKGQDLKIRESKNGVEILGVSMHPIHHSNDIMYLLNLGDESRHIASHALNSKSSRSHVIFTLYIEQSKVNQDGVAMRTKSKFNLIDLAGSERAERTGATGDLLKEGASINRSLSALGNVIKVLTDHVGKKGKKKSHVPYRDSMLTRLLSDSLGGTASTLMCCNLAPGSDHYFETLSSLEFAKRVKKVKNTVTLRTEKLSQKEAKAMVSEADQLRIQMEQMKQEHEQTLQKSHHKAQASDAQIELRKLRQEMEIHRRTSMAISKITKATASNDRRVLSDEGRTAAKKLTEADMSRLFFVDTDSHSMSFLDIDGSEPTFEIGRGIIGSVAQTGIKVSVAMAPDHASFDPDVDEASLTQTGAVGPLLAMPVIGESGDVIAVMVTARAPSKEAFTEVDAKLLTSICEHIAHAVDSHRSPDSTTMKLTTLTVSEAGQKFHTVMMQIASLCETRPKLAVLTEELLGDMINGAHGTLFFVGGAPAGEGGSTEGQIWSMHMKARPENHISGMKGIVGQCLRSRKAANIATSDQHPHYHADIDSHPTADVGMATMCMPVMSIVGDQRSEVIAALRIMSSVGRRAFGKEETAVLDLISPYVSAGLMRILSNDRERMESAKANAKLAELQAQMEAASQERDEREQAARIVHDQVELREAEIKKLSIDSKKKGLAAGMRQTLHRALEKKKHLHEEAVQESLTTELENMRKRQAIIEEQFENAKKELAKATKGQKTLKARHLTTKASQLLSTVDGKRKKKDLLKARKQAAAASQEADRAKKQLTAEQQKAKMMQKAHEDEVRRFRAEVKSQEIELQKKKDSLQRSMEEIRQKHVKKLMDLKHKLRSYKTKAEMAAGNTKSERSRRISVVLRSNFQSIKNDRLKETLRDMELELQNQQTNYHGGEVIDIDIDAAAAENNDTKSMTNLTNHRQPLPPTIKTVSVGTPSSSAAMHNGTSRHNKLVRQQQKLSPRRTRASYIFSCAVLLSLNTCWCTYILFADPHYSYFFPLFFICSTQRTWKSQNSQHRSTNNTVDVSHRSR